MMWEQSDNFSFAFFTPLRVLGGGVHPLQIEPAGTVQAGMRHLQEEAVGGLAGSLGFAFPAVHPQEVLPNVSGPQTDHPGTEGKTPCLLGACTR